MLETVPPGAIRYERVITDDRATRGLQRNGTFTVIADTVTDRVSIKSRLNDDSVLRATESQTKTYTSRHERVRSNIKGREGKKCIIHI